MKFYNKSTYILVQVFNQKDKVTIIPRWEKSLSPREDASYRPSSGDDHRYKARINVSTDGFPKMETVWVEDLADSGQWISIGEEEVGGKRRFKITKGVDEQQESEQADEQAHQELKS